jgi:hypothetical protein
MSKKYRHELKYRINYGEMALIKQRLQTIMRPDENATDGVYKIRSLYFDDYWHSAYTEKIIGVHDRRKYRIRIYNDSDRVIHLECKEKSGSYIHKTAAALSRDETMSIIAGQYDVLLTKSEPLCHEFYYQCLSRVLRPSVIVDYEREPFVCEAGDVRVTFDQNVRSSTMFAQFFNPHIPCTHVFDDGVLIMEVKFTELLPAIIRNALPGKSHDFSAFSKYTNCFEKAPGFSALTTAKYE